MKQKEANLKFKSYRVATSNIKLDVEAPRIEGKLEISIKNKVKTHGNDYIVELETTAVNESKTIEIYIKMCGYFSVDADTPEELKQTLLVCNAPVIMFPYVRAYVSSLTGLSGLAPVILPPLNFNK